MFELVDNEEIQGLEKEAADGTYEKYKERLPKGYLSVSQVVQYLKCGEAYFRRYVLDEPIPSNSFQVQGRGVHKAAEYMHLKIIANEVVVREDALSVYSDLHDKEIKDAVIDSREGTPGQIKDAGLRLTAKYYNVIMGEEKDVNTGFTIPQIKPIAAERVFKTRIATEHTEDIPFLGIIDLEEEDAISDLKTKKKAASQAEADNSLQLSIYAHVTGKPQVRLDQLIKPTKTLSERFIRTTSVRTKKEVAHALDIVAEVADDIAAGRFRKTAPDAWWCTETWCPYWQQCRGRAR